MLYLSVWKFCWNQIIDVLQQYCENFRTIAQVELVENLPSSYLPYRFLYNLHSFLQWEKVKIFDFFNQCREYFLCISSYDKWFWIKLRQLLQIYFCVKRQAKHDFLKDVESTLGQFICLQLIKKKKKRKRKINDTEFISVHGYAQPSENYFWRQLTLKTPRKSASENVACFCRLLNILANFFKPIFAYRQTVWSQIRLLLKEQSDLGPHCLQKYLLK